MLFCRDLAGEPSSSLEAADVAGPFHITIWQEFFSSGRIPLLAELLEHESVLVQGQKDGLRDLEMILCMCGRKQIVRNAIAFEDFEERLVIFLVDFLDRLPLFIRREDDGRTMRVCSRDHQNIVALKPVIAGDDVAGQVGTRDVSNVDLGVGIRPCNGDEYVFRHSYFLHEGLFSVAGAVSTCRSAYRSLPIANC